MRAPSSEPDPVKQRRVLYYGGEHRRFDRLFLGMVRAEETFRAAGDARTVLNVEGGPAIEFVPTFVPSDAIDTLREHYVNLLLLDLRTEGDFAPVAERARGLLEVLDHAEDVEFRYGFHRILALVPGNRNVEVDRFLLELGARGVRHVLREPDPTCAGPDALDAFATEVIRTAVRIMLDRRQGPAAVCASGGGITGIYFELGALKCLDDCLGARCLNDLDLFYGISAGAVVTSLLAVGYTVDELLAAIAGYEGGRIPPLSLSLLHPGHLAARDAGWRLSLLGEAAGRWTRRTLRGQRPGLDDVVMDSIGVLGAPFHSGRFEKMLRALLDVPGASNDFRRLPRPLFIGATDQDERKHVLFGSDGYDDVPISRAAQASLSINPAFGPVDINGRFYEDGAITRTSDFEDAIDRGATLVFVLDPFVPYVSEMPGFARRRGLLYNIDQDIRTISYTRFENTRNHVLRKFPEVSTYTFLPSNRQRRLLSVNPMDHRPWAAIAKAAYLSTLQRLMQLEHRIRGDLAEHGFVLSLTRAQEVAARLERATQPGIGDFFVDGRITLRTHPLIGERADG